MITVDVPNRCVATFADIALALGVPWVESELKLEDKGYSVR